MLAKRQRRRKLMGNHCGPLRWTLAQTITAAIPPGHDDLFRMMVRIASGFLGLSSLEEEALMA